MSTEHILANRLRKRQRHLRKWARRSDVSCYRLYERDIPEYPLIVDWYDGEAVVWLYERTRDETDAQAAAFREQALAEIQEGLELKPAQIFVKERQRQQGNSQYERLAQSGHVRIVQEQGLRFEVNLSDYLDTGLFLDHHVRARVRAEAQGRRVLNLFAYTGSFTCYALAGGACITTTVDLSQTYCDWTRRNLSHNGFAESAAHRIVQADCLAFLQEERQRRARYDLIICDPPTFSNSKRMAQSSFDVVRDHPHLIAGCANLLGAGGVLCFSTNARRFALDVRAAVELAN
ncbi:MAG: class I SAM-dependent methyltransferase [Caldilineaceae bacterium]